MTDLAANFGVVRDRIARACAASARAVDEVTLVAVSKGHSASAIQAAYDLGVRDFGESYVQEWTAKADALPRDIRWHFIGHLQSNKAKLLADRTHLVHTVDRASLAKELDKRWERPCDVLLQVNVDDDPAKKGAGVDDVANLLTRVLDQYPRLNPRGLMTIPALSKDPEAARPAFRRLREVRDALRARFRGDLEHFEHLSMGMTADLEVAIEEGATIVRVGTALFGPREP